MADAWLAVVETAPRRQQLDACSSAEPPGHIACASLHLQGTMGMAMPMINDTMDVSAPAGVTC
jgi:hypothetical protein